VTSEYCQYDLNPTAADYQDGLDIISGNGGPILTEILDVILLHRHFGDPNVAEGNYL
jgi:hypothetical protein